MTNGTNPNSAEQFLAEEYKALREEIKSLIAENQTMERFAGGAVAGVTTWLLTTKGISDAAFRSASFIPFAITAVIALRCFGIGLRLKQIGAYIREYEGWLMSKIPEERKPRFAGWETAFHHHSSKGSTSLDQPPICRIVPRAIIKAPFHTTARIYWVVLLFITSIFFLASLLCGQSDGKESKQATVTVSDPSGSSSTVTVPLGFTIEVKRPAK